MSPVLEQRYCLNQPLSDGAKAIARRVTQISGQHSSHYSASKSKQVHAQSHLSADVSHSFMVVIEILIDRLSGQKLVLAQRS